MSKPQIPLALQLADKKKFIPKAGFNLVGLDDYEKPGEQLFLVKNYKDRSEAESALKARAKANPGTKYFIYGPDGR